MILLNDNQINSRSDDIANTQGDECDECNVSNVIQNHEVVDYKDKNISTDTKQTIESDKKEKCDSIDHNEFHILTSVINNKTSL